MMGRGLERARGEGVKPISVTITKGALIAVVLAMVAAAAAGCSGPGNITSNDSIMDESAVFGQPSCVNAGDQVVVKNSSGTVIATATLTEDTAMEHKLDTSSSLQSLVAMARMDTFGETQIPVAAVGFYDFTVTVPGGLPRYGVTIGQHPQTWYSASDMKKGLSLSCGTSS